MHKIFFPFVLVGWTVAVLAQAAAPPPFPRPIFTWKPAARNPGAVALSADGRLLALLNEPNGREKECLEVWDIRTGRRLLSSPAPSRKLSSFIGGFLAFTPDANAVVMVSRILPKGRSTFEARVVEVPTGEVRKTFDLEVEHGRRGFLIAAGRQIVVSTDTNIPAMYDVMTGKRSGAFHPTVAKEGSPEPPPRVVEPEGAVRPASVMALSPDGRWLATSNDKGWLAVWDLTKRTRLWQTDEKYRCASIAFSFDGNEMASVSISGSTTTIWRVSDGKPERKVRKPHTRSLTYLPSGLLLLGRPGVCGFAPWDTDSNEEPFPLWTPYDPYETDEPDEKRLINPEERAPLALSADGSTLALIAQGGGVLVYDVRSIRSPRKK